MLSAGKLLDTTSSMGVELVRLTDARSFNESNGIFFMNTGLVACPLATHSSVCPSGAARAAISEPSRPLAPGRLSMITGWLSTSASRAPTSRPRMSALPPAP